MDNLPVCHKKGIHACMKIIATFHCLFTFYGKLFNFLRKICSVDEVQKTIDLWHQTKIFVQFWVFIERFHRLWPNETLMSISFPSRNIFGDRRLYPRLISYWNQYSNNQNKILKFSCDLYLQHILEENCASSCMLLECRIIWLLVILEVSNLCYFEKFIRKFWPFNWIHRMR